jgi:hypothetical protein
MEVPTCSMRVGVRGNAWVSCYGIYCDGPRVVIGRHRCEHLCQVGVT